MSETSVCWKCGGSLPELLVPLPRHEECPHCRVQLHACRMCVFFDPKAPQQCREPVADLVTDKQRANFCGYFQLNPHAFSAPDGQAAAARQALDSLFGDALAGTDAQHAGADDPSRDPLEQLFRK